MVWRYFIDFVDTLSPIVTLIFGIYGALADTKPKNGKLSRQGKIALSGMIISGMITLVVKGGSLYYKIQEQEKQLIANAEERARNRSKDSAQTVFEQTVANSFAKSIRELDTIRSDSRHTLNSLNDVADKQNIVLNDNKRVQNPLMPLQIEISYKISLKNFFRNNGVGRAHAAEIRGYLSSLKTEQQKSMDRYQRDRALRNPTRVSPDDTIAPRIQSVDPLINTQRQMLMSGRAYFFEYVLLKSITLKFTRIDQKSNKSLTIGLLRNYISDSLLMSGSIPADIGISCSVDIESQIATVQLHYPRPQVQSRDLADFVSFYDLGDTYLSIHVPHFRSKDSIIKIETIKMLTGQKLSRELNFQFSGKDIPKNNLHGCCYRKITLLEILSSY